MKLPPQEPLHTWGEYNAARKVIENLLHQRSISGELSENDNTELRKLNKRVVEFKEKNTNRKCF